MVQIDAHELSKVYGDRQAVRKLSFQVHSGELMGLVGPNGAGKTTTIRMLCGVIPPTSGRISISGHPVTGDAIEAKRNLALVPDTPNLFTALTVWEHLELAARLYRLEDGWQTAAEELLERVELIDRRDTVADELSRGMRQKVGICAALLHKPKVLLLDEPLTGLDPRGIRTLHDLIKESAQAGTAVLISTHLLHQLQELCTSYLLIKEGEQVVRGSLETIRQQMPRLRADAGLEEIFFEATEGPG